ncbi:MarR family transcriptional regulator [Streptomyces sp. NPDC002888]|uniref:MarR family transcriptional regulator n=1 Tax=Streptomyces sp. NPDC002888 TaxID=3364668 RepID=UPI00369FA210
MSGYELLARDLAACGRDGFTGELRVFGTPGGTFHLRDGLVVSVASPGAPGPEALLLRSGRVGGERWGELVRECGGSPWPAAALIAHGYAGAAQLRVVCVMALRDAAFAVAVGRVDGCEPVPGAEPPAAPVAVGETPTRLLQDTARKLAAIAALPYPVRPDRERPVPALLSCVGARMTALQNELLAHADGRRTARDLAFRTGRGVYTVTVEIARMLAEGFLECAGAPVPIPVRLPADGHGVRPREPAPPPGPRPTPPPGPEPPLSAPAALPRRQPGASGIGEALDPPKGGSSWKEFFRLRNSTTK